MVTTTGTVNNEAAALFQQAMAKARQVILDADETEEELVRTATTLIVAALEAVTPAIKLVDQYVGSTAKRGAVVDVPGYTRFTLLRNGKLAFNSSTNESDPAQVRWFSGVGTESALEFAAHAIDLINAIAAIYQEAMVKNQERHVKMKNMLDRMKLANAAFSTVFDTTPEA